MNKLPPQDLKFGLRVIGFKKYYSARQYTFRWRVEVPISISKPYIKRRVLTHVFMHFNIVCMPIVLLDALANIDECYFLYKF